MTLAQAALRAYDDLPPRQRDSGTWQWRCSRGTWDRLVVEVYRDRPGGPSTVTELLRRGPRPDDRLLGLPLVVDHDQPDGLDLVPVLPPAIANLPAVLQERLLELAQALADHNDLTLPELLPVLARALQTGGEAALADVVTAHLVARQGEPGEAMPSSRRLEWPDHPGGQITGPDGSDSVTLQEPTRWEDWDCQHFGHIMSWQQDTCHRCGREPTQAELEDLPQWQLGPTVQRTALSRRYDLRSYGAATDGETDDTAAVPYAGQDAASIRARLDAIDDTLAEAAEWEAGWDHPANAHHMTFPPEAEE